MTGLSSLVESLNHCSCKKRETYVTSNFLYVLLFVSGVVIFLNKEEAQCSHFPLTCLPSLAPNNKNNLRKENNWCTLQNNRSPVSSLHGNVKGSKEKAC